MSRSDLTTARVASLSSAVRMLLVVKAGKRDRRRTSYVRPNILWLASPGFPAMKKGLSNNLSSNAGLIPLSVVYRLL